MSQEDKINQLSGSSSISSSYPNKDTTSEEDDSETELMKRIFPKKRYKIVYKRPVPIEFKSSSESCSDNIIVAENVEQVDKLQESKDAKNIVELEDDPVLENFMIKYK